MRKHLATLRKWTDWYLRIHNCWAVLMAVATGAVLVAAYVQQWPYGELYKWGMCAFHGAEMVRWLIVVRLDVIHHRRELIQEHVLVVE